MVVGKMCVLATRRVISALYGVQQLCVMEAH